MLLTVSGPPGSGTSTAAAAVAEALSYEHISGGDIFRGVAEERGLTLLELNRRAEDDDGEIDRDLDRRQREIAQKRDDVVLESRLAGWVAGEHATLRIWLDAPLDVRAARVADREDTTVAEAREETRARAASEARRYREYYDIDVEDRSIYDLALNTARWDLETEIEIVVGAIETYDPATDEGAAPIPTAFDA